MHRLFILTALAGCAQDVSLNAIANEPPTAVIASHDEGDVVLEGFMETVRGAVDDDDDVTALDVRWFVDDEEVCAESPDGRGDARCDFQVPARRTIRVRLEVRDAEGELASDQLDLEVALTDAPVVAIQSPTADGRYYRNVPVSLVARATDGEDAPADLTVGWVSDVSGALDADAAPDAADLARSEALLAEGVHTLTATATDSTGKTGDAAVTIAVGPDNRPPECGILAPEDGSLQSYDADVPFLGFATDLDVASDILVIEVQSDVDGRLAAGSPDVEGGIDTTIRMTRGVHQLSLIVIDDAGATCMDSVTVDASNSAPTQPTVMIMPDPATALDDLVCSVTTASVDAEGDPILYGFRWLRDGVDVTADAITTDLGGDTISWESTAPGQVWTCEVRANDGLADGRAGVAEVEVVAPRIHQLSAATTHACQLDDADVLTCWGGDAFGALAFDGGRYTDVSAGVNHTCVITPSGDVACVGWEADGRTDTTGLVGVFMGLDAGDSHNCALDISGEVQCWGNNVEGQCDAPAGPFVEVTAGFRHSCARTRDNAVTCWGSDVYGRSTPPLGIELVSVTAGDQHSCGLDTSGTVHCWGRNNYGQVTPPGGSFREVSAGERYTCGVRSSGEVACWGALTGLGETNAPPAGADYIGVDVGHNLTCAIHEDGYATCWGENSEGQADAPRLWW